MYEVKIGNEWLDVVRIEKDGGVLALYDGKFRVFIPSAYDEVREKLEERPTEYKPTEEKPTEEKAAEKTAVKRTRKTVVKESGKK